jgi:antitoxin ParD1/3/4
MPTRNVVLSDHQAEVIESLVKSGRYQNASEVVREGLRLVEHRAAEDAARLEALKKTAQVGWDDVEAGRFVDVADEDLDNFISTLGGQVADRVCTAN